VALADPKMKARLADLGGTVASRMHVVPLVEKRIERLEHERLVLLRGGLDHIIALTFLASQDARWITGDTIRVDGGSIGSVGLAAIDIEDMAGDE
jgi:NAD(P)-dependent dehydrogenase (short-subunit alcohol dehydrogenase family)